MQSKDEILDLLNKLKEKWAQGWTEGAQNVLQKEYDNLVKEINCLNTRLAFTRSCALAGETWTQEAEDRAVEIYKS